MRFLSVSCDLPLTQQKPVSTVRHMTDDRRSSIALIAGSAGMVFTMILHPRGIRLAPDQIERIIRELFAVHGLALASLPLLFLGAWGLTRHVAKPDRLALIALVFYGFAIAAILNGAVFDGLAMPTLLRQMVPGASSSIDQWRTLFKYNAIVDEAYIRVFAVGSGAALVLWSASMLRSRSFSLGVAIYGLVLGAATVIGVLSGIVDPETHSFILVIFGESIWFIAAGARLWRVQQA